MARNVLVDAGFVVALLSSRDAHHEWAITQASEFPPQWSTCEAALSEAFHLLGEHGAATLGALLRRRALVVTFEFAKNLEPVMRLIEKYSDVPMGFADACLVRMTETLTDPVVLTTDQDFRVYRRHSRQVVPCVTPAR
jgi:predicted nucleic acid-binding protein